MPASSVASSEDEDMWLNEDISHLISEHAVQLSKVKTKKTVTKRMAVLLETVISKLADLNIEPPEDLSEVGILVSLNVHGAYVVHRDLKQRWPLY
jgi:hypothetical protein